MSRQGNDSAPSFGGGYDGRIEYFDPPTIETGWRENGLGNVVNDFVDDVILSSDTIHAPEDFTSH